MTALWRNPERAALLLLAGFFILRLTLMALLGFGVDESYTLAHAGIFQLSYFDHPPLHLWIAGVSLKMFGAGPLVRLPFVVLFSVTGWLIFLLTRHLFSGWAGVWAVFGLNVAIFFTASAGTWVVPDGPLYVCLSAAVVCLAVVLFPKSDHPSSEQQIWIYWLLAGLFFGLAGLAKYSAVLTVLGVFCFLLASKRHRIWLSRPMPWVAACIAGGLMVPVLIWNARHGWVSFAFQAGRGAPAHSINPINGLTMLGGELLWLLPWVAVALIMAMVRMAQNDPRSGRVFFLLSLALPPILVFSLVPIWGARGLPHWAMPGWLFAFPLLGVWLSDHQSGRVWPLRWAVGSLVALLTLAGFGVSQVRTGWLCNVALQICAKGDPSLEAFDWVSVADIAALEDSNDWHPEFVGALNWIDGGKIAQGLRHRLPVLVFSDDPRQFAFTTDMNSVLGKDGVFIVPEKRIDQTIERIESYFQVIDPPEHFSIGRSGRAEIALVAIRVHRLLHVFPLPYSGAEKVQ